MAWRELEFRTLVEHAPISLLSDPWRWAGIDRASDAFQQSDVSTNAFDDFFEYALTQPVTIHKNESAMVPILQQAASRRRT